MTDFWQVVFKLSSFWEPDLLEEADDLLEEEEDNSWELEEEIDLPDLDQEPLIWGYDL